MLFIVITIIKYFVFKNVVSSIIEVTISAEASLVFFAPQRSLSP